jgi:hypothetical protein
MKLLIMILALLTGKFNNEPKADNVKSLAVAKESKISILGSSNVNTFSFDIKQYSGKDTLLFSQRNATSPAVFKKGIIRLQVTEFKNSNPLLTKDFRKITKAKSHPIIVMNFKNLNVFPCEADQDKTGLAEVDIYMAGTWKTTRIKVNTCRIKNIVYINGSTDLCFADFGLSAPENVMGFINVNEELKVNFQLALKEVN